jgi:hypothetical protein
MTAPENKKPGSLARGWLRSPGNFRTQYNQWDYVDTSNEELYSNSSEI